MQPRDILDNVVPACLRYFKRYRMEIDLNGLPEPRAPDGCSWVAWDDALLEVHAEVLYASFRDEIDAQVFASLSDQAGCARLMREIRNKPGFLPAATWLLSGPNGFRGTVQGVRERSGLGAIQNLGVAAVYRGRGLGRALLLQALHGFRRAGLGRATLEVTADNDGAVRLYQRLGFRRRKTLYKMVSGPGLVTGPA